MRLAVWFCVIALALGPASPGAAQEHPSNNIREFFAYLQECVHLPAGSEGSEMTLRFGLTPEGMLRGKPIIAYAKLAGDERMQKRFVAAVLESLADCTPVPLSENFGRIISQQVISWRIRSGPAGQGI